MVSRPSVLDPFSFFGLFWDEKKHHILGEMFENPEPLKFWKIDSNRFQEIPIRNNHICIFDNFCVYTNVYLDLPKGAKWFLKGVNSPSLRV